MMITQLIAEFSKGDGAGNVITSLDNILKKQGFETKIIGRTLGMKDIELPEFQNNNVIIYHVTGDVDPVVAYLNCKKILWFHNITEPDLLVGKGLQDVRRHLSAGLEDIGKLADYFDMAMVPSEYSKKLLISKGWDENKIVLVPIMLRFDKFSDDYTQKIVEKYRDGSINILFTGRVFPNKRHEDLIYLFSLLKAKIQNVRLILVGSLGYENYVLWLKKYVRKLGLEDSVIFTGKVDFEDYKAYYKCADLFLCLSMHEGFCIPLVEAMHYDVPIVARNITAIPDTLGNAGVLVDTLEEALIEVERLIFDATYREDIIIRQKRRLEELQPEKLELLNELAIKKCISSKKNSKNKTLLDRDFCDEKVVFPERITSKGIVIYGFGQSGKNLLTALQNEGIHVDAICDKGKCGEVINDMPIISIEELEHNYKDCMIIISVQNETLWVPIHYDLFKAGVSSERIVQFKESIFGFI